MTEDDKQRIQARVEWVKSSLEKLHEEFPGHPRVERLHRQLNSVAIAAEDALSVPRGTFAGAAGAVLPDSGGTNKPPQSA